MSDVVSPNVGTCRVGRPRKASVDPNESYQGLSSRSVRINKNNEASRRYRHRKSDQKAADQGEITKLKARNQQLRAKHAKLKLCIKRWKLMLQGSLP